MNETCGKEIVDQEIPDDTVKEDSHLNYIYIYVCACVKVYFVRLYFLWD